MRRMTSLHRHGDAAGAEAVPDMVRRWVSVRSPGPVGDDGCRGAVPSYVHQFDGPGQRVQGPIALGDIQGTRQCDWLSGKSPQKRK